MNSGTEQLTKRRLWAKRGGIALLLLGAGMLLIWGLGLARTALALRKHLAQLQAMADSTAAPDPAAACGLVRDLRGDVQSLQRQAGGLLPLAPALGWLPWIGGDVRAAPHLLTVADGLSEAGALACDALEPMLGGADGLSPEAIVRLLAENPAAMEQALAATRRARAAWAQVDAARLSPWLARKTALLTRGLPLLEAGLAAATVAPEMLGADGARTYLVIALNEDELRATGGFISGVGEVRLEAGRLVTMTFRDSYAVDDFTQPYPLAPEPMSRFMGGNLMVFRDSNWSPDFPTAARQAIALYRPGYTTTVSGVIALDQRAVQEIIAAIGPLRLDGVEQPVSGKNILTFVRQAWGPGEEGLTGEWWQGRKSFMGEIAGAAWRRVQSGDVNWAALGRALLRILEEKHMLIYLEHPQAEALLTAQGWDGTLRPSEGDFLLVVDTNMGYNKVNARVNESIAYEIDLRQQPPRATLTLSYTHTGAPGVECIHKAYYGSTYEDMMDRCYWDYVRVYVPQGSALVNAACAPVPAEFILTGAAYTGAVDVLPAPEGPWLTFGAFALLPPATTQTRVFTWTLPADVVKWENRVGRYTLRVQKQPGVLGHPLTVSVRLPEGSRVLETAPAHTLDKEGRVVFRADLARDRQFEVRFRSE